MTWQEILRIFAYLFIHLIFIFAAHSFAYITDSELYSSNKYNENRRTIKVGFKWLFWRCKKDNSKEIFIVAFVHEIIDIVLFLGVVAELILFFSAIINVTIYGNIITIILFLYCAYCSAMQRIVCKNKIYK